MMNCIFWSQKAGIPLDTLRIKETDSVFLQQASHLTKGTYYRIERKQGLLQYLMMSFLPPTSLRSSLTIPHQDQVDLRAACFCHRKIVDIGFVCSVCLSIFCSPIPVCTTCRTKFPLATLRRLGFKPKSAGNRSVIGSANGSRIGTPVPTNGHGNPKPTPSFNPFGGTASMNGEGSHKKRRIEDEGP